MDKKVINTWIVIKGSSYVTLFETTAGNFYIPSHVVGQVNSITAAEAAKLIGG